MSVAWEPVHVFISSTFNDMHAERDYLVKQVFPRLHDWCERRKLRMVDIDLRWGVTEADATHNKNVVQVCLDRIDDCRPFFLCFLGQRYGWIPKPADIDEVTFEKFPGLAAAVADQSSVTDIEVLHSAMSPFHSPDVIAEKGYNPADHAFFYLRDDTYLSEIPDDPNYLKRIYSDAAERDAESREFLFGKQHKLREVTIPATGRPTKSYAGQWLADQHTPEIVMPTACPSLLEENKARWRRDWEQYGNVMIPNGDVDIPPSSIQAAKDFNRSLTSGRLGQFTSEGRTLGDVIFEDLTAAIEQRFPNHTEVDYQDDLQKELDQQEQFLFINSEGFIKRGGDFDDLDEYVSGDSKKMFVLTAEAGMGKSMLLANWVDHHRQQIEGEHTSSVHSRFVGASDGSTSVPRLLHYLLRELSEFAGKIVGDEKIPDDPNEIRTMWREQFAQLGDNGKTVIVIDALNQLESGLSDLHWLPRELPAGVKLIVSFKSNEEDGKQLLESYETAGDVILSSVNPFESDDDRRSLVREYLKRFLKELDEQHIDSLIGSPGAGNPLYLKVVLSELRVFGSFSSLGEKIAGDFGDTPQSAFIAVLKRLESDPAYSAVASATAVPLLFGLLAHARRGLSVEELTELFRLDLGWDDNQRAALQESVELFLRQVRPFLARRDGRHDFFYESFYFATRNRYVATEAESATPRRTTEDWHTSLADYFLSQLNPAGEAAWSGESPRALSELPYHQTQGKLWELLKMTLCDLLFVAAKIEAGMTFDLVQDYSASIAVMPDFEDQQQNVQQQRSECSGYAEALEDYAARWNDARTWHGQRAAIADFDTIQLPVPPRSCLLALKDTNLLQQNSTGNIGASARRLASFATFVTTHSNDLATRPRETISVARNHSTAGPVVAQAEPLAEELDRIWIGRDPRLPALPLHPQCLQVLEGHTDWVESVALTADGRRAVSASYETTLRVWDLDAGRQLAVLRGHTGPVRSVAITADGQRAVSVGDDKTLRVWNLMSDRELAILTGHTSCVYAVALTADGRRAVSAGDDKTLRVWDLETGLTTMVLKGHMEKVAAIALTADGRRAVSASDDKTLRIWDLETGLTTMVLKGHMGKVTAVALTADGQRAVSASCDKTLRVWDLESGRQQAMLEGHLGPVRSVALTADGRGAVSVADDKTLRVWNLESGDELAIINGHTSYVYAVALTADGRRAVSSGNDYNLRVWDLDKGCPQTVPEGHTAPVRSVAITADGRRAVSAGDDKTLRVWDVETGCQLAILNGHTGTVRSVAITADGRRAVSAGDDKTLRVWDVKRAHQLAVLRGHTAYVWSVALTADGRRAISAGDDKTLRVWDVDSCHELAVLEGHSGPVWSVVLTADGRKAISAGDDKTLRVWDVDSCRELAVLAVHMDVRLKGIMDIPIERLIDRLTGGVYSVSVAADGQRAVSASDDKKLRVWDLESSRELAILEGPSGRVSSMALTADGQQAISVSGKRILQVWDLESGNELAVHITPFPVNCVSAILANGRFACGLDDGQVQFLWLRSAGCFHSKSGQRPQWEAWGTFQGPLSAWTVTCGHCGHVDSGDFHDRPDASCPKCGYPGS